MTSGPWSYQPERLMDRSDDAQDEKMEAVGLLAAGVAHDFNSLLTVINGYSEMMLEGLPGDSPLREMLVEIRQAGGRSAELIRQLLAFSGQQVLAPRLLDLNSLVRKSKRQLRQIVGERVVLVAKLHPETRPLIADPVQLEHALMNLGLNARDAMPDGGTLTLETRNEGNDVVLSVSDTGHGIPLEIRLRLFEPFFTTKKLGQEARAGLGLATVYGVVKQMGGRITVTSEVGEGSSFHLAFAGVDGQDNGERPAPLEGQAPSGQETVLVVDDEAGLRALASRVLKRSGYNVLEAPDGAAALGLLEQHPETIHLLLTDVVMPGASGPEVARRAAEKDPSTRVLFMSGFTDDAIVREGVSRHEVQFLSKPFSPLELARKVRQVLDGPG